MFLFKRSQYPYIFLGYNYSAYTKNCANALTVSAPLNDTFAQVFRENLSFFHFYITFYYTLYCYYDWLGSQTKQCSKICS